MKNKKQSKREEKISRKTALKKIGMTAFTTGTMMFLLSNPAKAQPSFGPGDDEWEW